MNLPPPTQTSVEDLSSNPNAVLEEVSDALHHPTSVQIHELKTRIHVLEHALNIRIRAEQDQKDAEQKVLDDEAREEKNARIEASARERRLEEYNQMHSVCCILPSDRVICHHEATIRKYFPDGAKLNRKRLCHGFTIWLIVTALWVTSLAFASIKTNSEFTAYNSYKWIPLELNTTLFDQLCQAPGCTDQCENAISRPITFMEMELMTNGVDCELPHGKYGGVIRIGLVIAMIFDASLFVPVFMWLDDLVFACRHCKHY